MRPAAGVIPARFQSTRFPGKPLALIKGRPMIQWVWEAAQSARYLAKVVIATDDERIFEASLKFGAQAVMTSSGLQSGTERVAEAANNMDFPIIINIQGDEPLLKGALVDDLVLALQDERVSMSSLMARVQGLSGIQEKDRVKVVVDHDGFALYFSRSPIPFLARDFYFLHIGCYGYQRDFLFRFCGLAPSFLEKAENLEQLRALENGYRIKMIETSARTLSVDSPQDIIEVERLLGD